MTRATAAIKRVASTLLLMLLLGPGSVEAQPALDVTFDPAGTNLTATDVQSAIASIDAQLLGPVATFVSIQLPEPAVGSTTSLMSWPTLSPVSTQFYRALTSNNAGGAWPVIDNIWCTGYNRVGRCTGANGDPSEHAFAFNLELSFQLTTPASELIEQNFDFFAADGPVKWRAWALHIAHTSHTSSWNVERGLDGQAFEFNKNGNMQVGIGTIQPPRNLHVVGNGSVWEDLEVQGSVSVTGLVTRATNSPSFGPLLWGDGSDQPDEICLEAGYECFGAHELGGAALLCAKTPTGSGFFARCGCSNIDDADADGVLACVDSCPSIPNANDVDTDGNGAGDACDDDDDGDGLPDTSETGTGIFLSPTDTGTDPLDSDSDDDGFIDAVEVTAGSDPNNAGSIPSPTPVPVTLHALIVSGLALLGVGLRALRD